MELYNLTFFEDEAEARFLSLITIVETLAERGRRSSDILTVVEKCLQLVRDSDLDSDKMKVLLSRLGKGRSNESLRGITGGCCRGLSRVGGYAIYSPPQSLRHALKAC